MPGRFTSIFLLALLTLFSGCVRRTISITSSPPGALVWVNDQEIGRTPVDVDFVYYGTYDVRLVKDGYEPPLTFGDAAYPLWDLPGPDFFAEIVPIPLHSEVEWHYELEPKVEDREALLDRARELRHAAITESDSAAMGPQSDVAAQKDD